MPTRTGSKLSAAFAGDSCYIVAEAGSNHCGQLDTALELVDVAAQAGADAVKFQLFAADRMYPKGAGAADYLNDPTSIEEIIRSIELPGEWLPKLATRASAKGIDFLATPFDEDAVERLDPYVPAFKVASYELTHEPLLRSIGRRRKPVIASTGGATLNEARRATDVLRQAGAEEIVVLQCTARYPAPLDTLNVAAIDHLRRELGVPAGLSDHSREPLIAAVAAVALGAVVIEKHFTLSNDLPGPDHRFALEPAELAAMVTAVREAERALGSGLKEVHPEEEELRAFARRSVFSLRNIDAGEVLDERSIAVLRRGKLGRGAEPADYELLLGRHATRPIAAHTPVGVDDVD